MKLCSMNLAVSTERLQRSLDFGPVTVILTAEDNNQDIANSSHESFIQAWNLFLSHGRQFLEKKLAPIPITFKQQRSFRRVERFWLLTERTVWITSIMSSQI